MFHSEIIGVGSYVPEKKVTNQELENIVDTSDQWITSRTGIAERRVSTGEKTSQIALKAAQRAIKKADIKTDEITGFIYGLQIADQFIKSGQSQCALVIGAEILSKVLDWNDRNTCVLFGDGAGAVVLKRSMRKGIVSTYSGSQGDLEGFLTIPAVSVKNPFFTDQSKTENRSYMFMNGKEIFKFATHIMLKSIQIILKDNRLTIHDIKYIVPHQANFRIIDNVAKKLKVPPEKFYKNMDHFGNTSAASIPLALDEMVEKKMIQNGDRMIMVGFGGGLTWGSILLNWTL